MKRIFLGWCLVWATGCGKPAAEVAVSVRGSATFQGRSMGGGLICFTPDRDRGCAGKIVSTFVESDGTFQFAEPLLPGWYRIGFAEPPEWYGSDWERAFPASLRRPEQSGVEREVKPGGENVYVFPIELRE